jgi:hypothetical protein
MRLRALPEGVLRRRGFGIGAGHLPHALAALAGGRFDVAHAFAPADALVALAWARTARRPVLLTFGDPLRREAIAAARLRLEALEAAVRRADAVLAASEEARASLHRLLALETPCVPVGDAAAHLALYRRLGAGQT